jgi:hypothetical protein
MLKFLKQKKKLFEQFSWISCTTLKSGGAKDHIRQIKVPGATPYWKASLIHVIFYSLNLSGKNNS